MFNQPFMLNAPINTLNYSFNNPAWAKFDIATQGSTTPSASAQASTKPVVTDEMLKAAEEKGKKVFDTIDGRTKDTEYENVVASFFFTEFSSVDCIVAYTCA